jgi:hypothetical protein
MAVSTNSALPCVDLSCGLSVVGFTGTVVTAAAGGCCRLLVLLLHPSAKAWASPVNVSSPASGAVCRDSRVVVDSSVEGSLSAHPSRYRRLRSALQFNLLFIIGSSWGRVSGESLSIAVSGQQRWRLWVSSTSLEVFVGRLYARSLIFQVQTLLQLRRGGDSGFNAVCFLKASPWKSH